MQKNIKITGTSYSLVDGFVSPAFEEKYAHEYDTICYFITDHV